MSNQALHPIRNVVAGLLAGCGIASFFCFFALEEHWRALAPSCPNRALGLIYTHNEHGSYTYFSAFQATACWLMFWTWIPLGILGALIAPKKNIVGRAKWFGASYRWDQDDPSGLLKWAMLVGAVLAPFFLLFIGPRIVRGLNAAGVVMNLG